MASDDERDASAAIPEVEQDGEVELESERLRQLPADLPTSLDDRRSFPSYNQETEYYDAWQGTEHGQLVSLPT